MLELFGYRAALYLSGLIAALNLCFLLYVHRYLPSLGYDIAIYILAALIILLGLWLLSRIARYAGAAFYMLCAGSIVVTLWGFAKPVSVALVWAVAMGMLSLAAALIQVFSKRFAREFAAEREKRPPYKRYLLHAFTFVIILAAAAGALVDIVTFFKMMSAK
jgi:hypothetical protein